MDMNKIYAVVAFEHDHQSYNTLCTLNINEAIEEFLKLNKRGQYVELEIWENGESSSISSEDTIEMTQGGLLKALKKIR